MSSRRTAAAASKRPRKPSRSTQSRASRAVETRPSAGWSPEARAGFLAAVFVIFALGAAALMAAHDASRDNSVAIADVPSDAQLPAENAGTHSHNLELFCVV